ncbi:hypothetical protein AVEN_259294-1 [Araneus ventricosus]|uniref:Uncharacterized protein n=1 Tax=Araneus ventricosus TaxID=182803 RepID=A0A4Y2GHG9_ARAVE|nr:hypothetical protein AVEN_259294-1 [Araneus ventricosus]
MPRQDGITLMVMISAYCTPSESIEDTLRIIESLSPDFLQHAKLREDSRTPPPPLSILHSPHQPEEYAAIRNLNNRKAPEPDGFYADVIK